MSTNHLELSTEQQTSLINYFENQIEVNLSSTRNNFKKSLFMISLYLMSMKDGPTLEERDSYFMVLMHCHRMIELFDEK